MTQTTTMGAGMIKDSCNLCMMEIDALNTQTEITTATTRLWVTSSWYLRWRWIAKNLSTVNAKIPKCEAKTNIRLWIRFVYCITTISGAVCVLVYFHHKNCNYSGWTSKPTTRLDTARLRSNVFKVLGNDDVFLSACIVMMFNKMLVKHKKALKTTSVKCKPLTLAILYKGPWSVFSF